MARIIVPRSNGLYDIYSTVTDSFIFKNIKKDEYIDIVVHEESKKIIENLNVIFEDPRLSQGDVEFFDELINEVDCI